MQSFNYCNPTKILFGRGREAEVGGEIRAFGGSRVLFVYGGGSIRKSGLYDRILESLSGAGLQVLELSGVQPNPRLGLVREGIALAKKEKADFVLAVGGGSVIDTAKAIALGACTERDIWEFTQPAQPIEQVLPLGTVLTIPASGSESSAVSVLVDPERKQKAVISNPALYPKFSILNPELTFTMPPYQIACGASDMLAHLLERYFTQEPYVEITDRLLEGAIRCVMENAPRAIEQATDYNIRAELMWAATLAHNDSLDTGREPDWATHTMENTLAAACDQAHGAGLAVLYPAWMKYCWKAYPGKFIQLATRAMDVPYCAEAPERTILDMIAKLEAWYKSLGLPIRLRELTDVDDVDFEDLAKKCTARGPLGHFTRLDEGDVKAIYKLAL